MQHAVMAMGAVLVAATLFSVAMRSIRQSTIVAFLLVGIGASFFRESFPILRELLSVFTELGVILLLFVSGLELDIGALIRRKRRALIFGACHTLLNIVAAMALGYWAVGLTGATALVYFGLCLTLSSSTVALAALRTRRELGSFHGQVVLALMGLQNVVAVASLVVVKIMGSADPPVVAALATVAKMCGVGILVYLTSKFLLVGLFRYYAHAKELLFIGSMSWAMGVACFCELINFSPEIGAFMAGTAVAALPYRLEVQDRVEPMRDFGIVLFFVALGYGFNAGRDTLGLLGPVAVTSLFVLLVTPILILLVGYFAYVKSKPLFLIGLAVNQVSEFSLIVTLLCVRAGVLPESQLLLMTLCALTTIVVSGYGQLQAERLYRSASGALKFLDRHSENRYPVSPTVSELAGHVVVIKYNELAEAVIEHYLAAGRTVLLLDLDPDVGAHLAGGHPNLICMYLDAYEPSTRDRAAFARAHVLVSCMIGALQAELGILAWLRSRRLSVPFLVATDSRADALTLYDGGATFVIQTEDMAAEQLRRLLGADELATGRLRDAGRASELRLRQLEGENRFAFM